MVVFIHELSHSLFQDGDVIHDEAADPVSCDAVCRAKGHAEQPPQSGTGQSVRRNGQSDERIEEHDNEPLAVKHRYENRQDYKTLNAYHYCFVFFFRVYAGLTSPSKPKKVDLLQSFCLTN